MILTPQMQIRQQIIITGSIITPRRLKGREFIMKLAEMTKSFLKFPIRVFSLSRVLQIMKVQPMKLVTLLQII